MRAYVNEEACRYGSRGSDRAEGIAETCMHVAVLRRGEKAIYEKGTLYKAKATGGYICWTVVETCLPPAGNMYDDRLLQCPCMYCAAAARIRDDRTLGVT